MNTRINRVILLLVFLAAAAFNSPAVAARPQEDERLLETVYVENVEVPIRVFDGKKPVQNLKRTDFTLYVNGKKKKINAFFETKRKLTDYKKVITATSPKTASQPRLFALLFNVSDYHLDLITQLDFLFERIIRPGDFIIIITNNYFFPEWKVMSPEKTKEKLRDILQKEVKKLKFDMLGFKSELLSLAASTKSDLASSTVLRHPELAYDIFREFFLGYQFILADIQRRYMRLPLEQYMKIAKYIKGQEADKWVLNFYQLARLPMMDRFAHLHKELERYMGDNMPRELRQNLKRLYHTFSMDLYKNDDLLVKEAANIFLDTGASFHTLLMKSTSQDFMDTDFKNETMSTDTENVLKKLAALTGGSVVRSNLLKDFVKKITQKEDIVYTLTYIPGPRQKKSPSIEVKINTPGYRVVYDSRKRAGPWQERLRRLTAGIQSLEIASLACSGDTVTVKLKNMAMVSYEKERFGAVRARIKIEKKDSKAVRGFEKTFKGIKKEGIFQIAIPPLSPGRYRLVVEVRDLFSLKNIYAGDAVSFTRR